VILLFQKRVCASKNSTTYHIVGYTTLYKFLSYPSDWTMRLSQILILPPYQRAGHGQKLLQLVYDLAEQRKAVEINIEDPRSIRIQSLSHRNS
jgi:histone acetyltransferase 1